VSTPLVIVGCGKAKQHAPAPALELYTGGYFEAARAYALTLAPEARILVLSAKYGLLRGDRVIAPYDLKMGQPGAITPRQVAVQASAMGLTHELQVISLAGRLYEPHVRAAWPHARFPLHDLPGRMGGRKKWLLEQAGR
jgi:hypothetical protein